MCDCAFFYLTYFRRHVAYACVGKAMYLVQVLIRTIVNHKSISVARELCGKVGTKSYTKSALIILVTLISCFVKWCWFNNRVKNVQAVLCANNAVRILRNEHKNVR